MARPNLSAQRREELLPVVTATFAELGYRRTTTAELAQRCGVQEAILYRLWPDKRAMFTAAIRHVAEHSRQVWQRELAPRASARSRAEVVLDYESRHLGEHGLYRILFAGLSETDDRDIVDALRTAYRDFQQAILQMVREHRGKRSRRREAVSAELVAWAMVGIGTAVSLGHELQLMPVRARAQLLKRVGRALLD